MIRQKSASTDLKLPGYRILKLIGEGQYGRVYAAVQENQNRIVALKQLELNQLPTDRFLQELNCLVHLRHPNIVTCHSVDYHGGKRYLVMDYCKGGTLRDRIKSYHLSTLEKLRLVVQILKGLLCAHRHQIIHCDIKPENILIDIDIHTQNLIARIGDFGLARIVQETAAQCRIGYTGSPGYMAPERYYGYCSYASDIYSVGIILYELLTGSRPFEGSPAQIMMTHLNQPVQIPKTVPFFLHTVIKKSLNKLPQKRYKSAVAMINDLRLSIQLISMASKDFPG